MGFFCLLRYSFFFLSVCTKDKLLRYQGLLPSPWPFLKRVLHLDQESLGDGDLTTFLLTNITFKVFPAIIGTGAN